MLRETVGIFTICLAVALAEFPDRHGSHPHRQQHECISGPETGPCRASMPMYFYNVTSGACEPFIYGGCGGNGNRFRLRRVCERWCTEVPVLPELDPEELPVPDPFDSTESESQEENLDFVLSGESQDVEPTPCRPRSCRRYCQYGFQTDENGCEICRCRRREEAENEEDAAICPEIRCRIHCEFGFDTNKDDGCPICRCLRQPREEMAESEVTSYRERRSLSDLLRPRQLPAHCRRPAFCRRYCEFGFQEDDNGCQTCRCNPRPSVCEPVICRRYCEFGFQVDDNGCQTCRCNPRPTECSPVMCMMHCQHGFEVNQYGCEICSCRGPPDLEVPESRRQERSVLPLPSEYDDACFLEPARGPCRARRPRWFFNPQTGNCHIFYYGGCRGNENNFQNERDCLEYCTVPEREIRRLE